MFAFMRFLGSFGALLMLAACATAPTSTATATQPAAAVEAPSRIGQTLASAGRADAPTQAEIERLLGAPDIARQEGAGAALTYRYERCALLLVFAADARNEKRLAEAHPSARRGGEAAPTLEACADEAAARR